MSNSWKQQNLTRNLYFENCDLGKPRPWYLSYFDELFSFSQGSELFPPNIWIDLKDICEKMSPVWVLLLKD